MSKPSYVYITADEDRNLAIRVAKDLDVALSLDQEQAGKPLKIVYFEEYATVFDAHQRFAEILRMSKRRRAKLVSKHNPDWKNLVVSAEWVGPAGEMIDIFCGRNDGPFDDFGESAGGVFARIPVGPLGPREGVAASALPSIE